MPTYVCANDDGFISDDDAVAMDHIDNNPGHQIVRIERDVYTGEIDTTVIDSHEPENG